MSNWLQLGIPIQILNVGPIHDSGDVVSNLLVQYYIKSFDFLTDFSSLKLRFEEGDQKLKSVSIEPKKKGSNDCSFSRLFNPQNTEDMYSSKWEISNNQ